MGQAAYNRYGIGIILMISIGNIIISRSTNAHEINQAGLPSTFILIMSLVLSILIGLVVMYFMLPNK